MGVRRRERGRRVVRERRILVVVEVLEVRGRWWWIGYSLLCGEVVMKEG